MALYLQGRAPDASNLFGELLDGSIDPSDQVEAWFSVSRVPSFVVFSRRVYEIRTSIYCTRQLYSNSEVSTHSTRRVSLATRKAPYTNIGASDLL